MFMQFTDLTRCRSGILWTFSPRPLLEKFSCISATFGPVESVISCSGLFMRPYRARLEDKTLCDLVLIKCNKHLTKSSMMRLCNTSIENCVYEIETVVLD